MGIYQRNAFSFYLVSASHSPFSVFDQFSQTEWESAACEMKWKYHLKVFRSLVEEEVSTATDMIKQWEGMHVHVHTKLSFSLFLVKWKCVYVAIVLQNCSIFRQLSTAFCYTTTTNTVFKDSALISAKAQSKLPWKKIATQLLLEKRKLSWNLTRAISILLLHVYKTGRRAEHKRQFQFSG